MATTPTEDEHQREEGHLRRLGRLLAGRTTISLVFLVADDDAVRDRIEADISALWGGETVRIEREDEASTDALIERLAGVAAAGPVQVTEPGAWPEGFKMFCRRLNYGRPKFGEQVRRGLLMWITTAELKELSQEASDFWCWRSAILDFTGNETDTSPSV